MNQDKAVLPQNSIGEVTEQAAEVAEMLRSRLLEVAREVAGPAFRPSRLVELLGIDKSLASRISRGLRSGTSYELLHLVPSPPGLTIFLDSAARAGCPANLVRRAREGVAEFQGLIDRVAGGRAALDAVMSDTAIEVRERAERTASQSVYRAMSYLLGFRCETITSALILQPSADGTSVDGLEVGRREGIRRLRPSAPVAIFNVNVVPAEASDAPRIEMLRPDADPRDPRSVLVPEFCDPPAPPLDLYETGHHTVFALPHDQAALNSGVTISSAFFVRNAYARWRREDQEEEFRLYLLHYPCKLLIRDLYIRDDLYVGSQPHLRLEFPSPPGAPPPRTPNPAIRLTQLDLAVPVVSLGRGLHRSAAAGTPQHSRLLAHVFSTAGLDPERFRGYRVRVMYAVPMITMGWWIPLPSPPRG